MLRKYYNIMIFPNYTKLSTIIHYYLGVYIDIQQVKQIIINMSVHNKHYV